jgi:hypothetical protein
LTGASAPPRLPDGKLVNGRKGPFPWYAQAGNQYRKTVAVGTDGIDEPVAEACLFQKLGRFLRNAVPDTFKIDIV